MINGSGFRVLEQRSFDNVLSRCVFLRISDNPGIRGIPSPEYLLTRIPVIRAVQRQHIFIVIRVEKPREIQLLQIVQARNLMRARFCLIQGCRQQTCEDRNDDHHDHQLDQRKSRSPGRRVERPALECAMHSHFQHQNDYSNL